MWERVTTLSKTKEKINVSNKTGNGRRVIITCDVCHEMRQKKASDLQLDEKLWNHSVNCWNTLAVIILFEFKFWKLNFVVLIILLISSHLTQYCAIKGIWGEKKNVREKIYFTLDKKGDLKDKKIVLILFWSVFDWAMDIIWTREATKNAICICDLQLFGFFLKFRC